MRLNNYSYVHKKILFLVYSLKNELGVELRTDLKRDLYEIRFENELQYLLIDFRRCVVHIMGIKLDVRQREMVEDLMMYLDWIYMGEKYSTKKSNNF